MCLSKGHLLQVSPACKLIGVALTSKSGASAWRGQMVLKGAALLLILLPIASPFLTQQPPTSYWLESSPRSRLPGVTGCIYMGPAPPPADAVKKPRQVPFHQVSVRPLPAWMPVERLLGAGEWRLEEDIDEDGEARLIATSSLARKDACWLAARIRGLGFGGQKLELFATPPLPRTAVRAARTEEARARRDTSPGFIRSGVKLDDVGKFSLTPEQLAVQLAEDERVMGRRVIDATCGAGGNAIAFARAGCQVVAIERDRHRLELARHNARVYGVPDDIDFLHGDARSLVPEIEADILFLDVPWGQEYDKVSTNLDSLPLLREVLGIIDEKGCEFSHVLAKVPPSFDPATTPQARPEVVSCSLISLRHLMCAV